MDQHMTVPKFRDAKGVRKLAMLTAYDYISGRLADEADLDGILVGDSLGMVVQGQETTLPVTLEQMIYHAQMVGRGVRNALLVMDMPFPSYHISLDEAMRNAARVLQETRCQAVKIEGGVRRRDRIAKMVDESIPVMGHIGLTPQDVHHFGGYRVQREREALLADAKAVEEAGAFAVVLECIPADLATEITEAVSIPTIGIGAGAQCDGQILVLHDLLGMTDGPAPKHARQYADLGGAMLDAIGRYRHDVVEGQFPGEGETFH